jgi:hypothetical protein
MTLTQQGRGHCITKRQLARATVRRMSSSANEVASGEQFSDGHMNILTNCDGPSWYVSMYFRMCLCG